uniref:Unkown protein n=1 Tax=Riptortus pedestris TaxID=329032 RepID=R4WE47_RIPPE|nr:unkown protein [Riptortus pedestris]
MNIPADLELQCKKFMCFRAAYYKVPLKKISDDFPIELISNVELVCQDCARKELQPADIPQSVRRDHATLRINEFENNADDYQLFRKTCYFCMKPIFKQRTVRQCLNCMQEMVYLYPDPDPHFI